jgi:hypothetical protein
LAFEKLLWLKFQRCQQQQDQQQDQQQQVFKQILGKCIRRGYSAFLKLQVLV